MTKKKKKITILAPAKINLYLHIIDKLPNNYHMLDSLAAFVDIGDIIEIEQADEFGFTIQGEFSEDLKDYDISTNLVSRAINLISKQVNKVPDFHVTLTKNLPIASGIGGGSSDAAATIWGVMEWWNIPIHAPFIDGLMLEIGADVPVCLKCKASRMLGLGDIIQDAPRIPETPILLVNNGMKCPTPEIYSRFNEEFKSNIIMPEEFVDIENLVHFLKQQDNDLTPASIDYAPSINNVLELIANQDNCLLSRMSGSGSTCFGIFNNMNDAKAAGNIIKLANPEWWVKSGWLGRPERY